MTGRDDMRVTPRATPPQGTTVAQRSAEERRARRAARQQRRGLAGVRRAAKARAATRLAGPRRAKGPRGSSFASKARIGAAGALRAVSVVGLMAEGLIMLGRAARRIDGESGRLLDKEDSATMIGRQLETIAKVQTRGDIESNPDLLRIIGQEGGVTSQIRQLAEDYRTIRDRTVRGEDEIDRAREFDSADTFLDRLIAKVQAEGIGELMNEAADAVRKVRDLQPGK